MTVWQLSGLGKAVDKVAGKTKKLKSKDDGADKFLK
jgi:hypothetical protein